MEAIFLPDKIDLNIKAIRTYKEGPSNSTSVYLFEETQTLNPKDIYIHMFIAELFTIAKIWKQPKCLLKDEWIKEWYIHIRKYGSTLKKSEILLSTTTWMDLLGILLNEISQTEKEKYQMISLVCGI